MSQRSSAELRGQVAWLGLGSNLDDPAGQIRVALDELANSPDVVLLAQSRLFETTPVGGPPGQPMYCNACAAISTPLAPLALLELLQAIERAHGRVRDVRWGPRTLDLDILAMDARQMNEPRLVLPHPRAHERGFVLVPLAEIAPALALGHRGRVIDCLAEVDTSGIKPCGLA